MGVKEILVGAIYFLKKQKLETQNKLSWVSDLKNQIVFDRKCEAERVSFSTLRAMVAKVLDSIRFNLWCMPGFCLVALESANGTFSSSLHSLSRDPCRKSDNSTFVL